MSPSMGSADAARNPVAADLPATFGRYRLLSRIGIGGMAEVYRGVVRGPEGWERELVVKRILPQFSDSADFRRMFIREAKISALLLHPNIVQVYEFGEAEGTYFIAMESVQGVTLRTALTRLKREQRALPFMVTADIARQICTGLDYAHTLRAPTGAPLQIVHQDISPTNVMLAYNGTVKLLDFGIARAAAFAEDEAHKGTVKGKVAYLSPEQIDLRPFDHRADLFALGAVMHEMLTGVRLFPAKNDVGRMKEMLARPILPPSSVNAAVPRELDRIVMQALAVDPEQRYATAAAMAADLERTLIAARYSSRDLSKLLSGLFGSPGQPRVLIDGAPQSVSGTLDSGPGSLPEAIPSTEKIRPVRGERAGEGAGGGRVTAVVPESLSGALRAERSRLVREQWRGRAKIGLVAAALTSLTAAGAMVIREYAPAVMAVASGGTPAPVTTDSPASVNPSSSSSSSSSPSSSSKAPETASASASSSPRPPKTHRR